MKTLYLGSGLLFAGLMITGILLTYFDIQLSHLKNFINESNVVVKFIAYAGTILTIVGGMLLVVGIFS